MINEILNISSECKAQLVSNIIEKLQALIPSDITAIQWQQYTPYFNDGSDCHFSVYDPYFIKNSQKVYSYNCDPRHKPILHAIEFNVSEIDDTMLFAFGDHVQVTVYKDTYVIEEYDHE